MICNTQSQQSDRQLLEAYRAGNPDAISQLIARHSKRVYDYIYMMVKDAELADDLHQETFVKVVKVIDQGRYTDSGRFLSWVMRIAHNQVIDHFRSQKHDNTINESSAGFDIIGTQRLSEGSVEDAMVSDQIAADLRKLIEQLPDEQREVVKMRYYANMSFKDPPTLSTCDAIERL